MIRPALRRTVALAIAILSTAPVFGQLTLTIQATENFSLSYDADAPSLTVTADSITPALNYAGFADKTFTMQFLAPTGFKFVIDPVDGPLTFDFQVAFATGEAGGLNANGLGSFSVLGFEGTAPTIVTAHATTTDHLHTYFDVSLTGVITDSFSFTGLQYSFEYTGIPYLSLLHFQGGNFSVSDFNYTGFEPPNHSAIITLSPIPEPSTYAALAGAAALGLAIWRRRSRRV